MKRLVLALCLTFALLSGGTLPSSLQHIDIQTELAGLAKRGIAYRMIDNQTVELTDPVSGMTRVKSLKTVDEAAIRSWVAGRGVPILEIDPSQVDTTLFSKRFSLWAQVPLSSTLLSSLIIEDFDGNGRPEIYGVYKERGSNDYQAQAFEIDSSGGVVLKFSYQPYNGVPRKVADVDHNSLLEILFFYGGRYTCFEQPSQLQLPILPKFVHNSWQGNLDPGQSDNFIGNLDGDTLTDFLYKGSEIDTSVPTGASPKVYVCEYDSDSSNFRRVWSKQFLPDSLSTTSGFAVGDFDNDGLVDFTVTEAFRSRVYVSENIGDDNYAQVWQDSTPFVNLYYQAAGDVDGNGKPEIFLQAPMLSGNWILVYESDAVHHYSLRFVIHLLAGGIFDFPSLTSVDLEGDGHNELATTAGDYFFVFSSEPENGYRLSYLKRVGSIDHIQLYDFDHNGKPDLVVSKIEFDSLYRGRFTADLYLESSGTYSPEIHPGLPGSCFLTSFPNPFNPSTTITYEIPSRSRITLKVFNLLGEEVATLVDGEENAGKHSAVWNATGMVSGVYFCRLQAGERVMTSKLLLIK